MIQHAPGLRRVLVLLALLVCSALAGSSVVVMASSGPAYAESSDIKGGGGGTSSNGLGGGSGGLPVCGQNGYGDSPADGSKAKNYFLAPFPGCAYKGAQNQYISGRIDSCTTGFDVWRFYGTTASPAHIETVSKVNMPDWCQSPRTYRYFLPNPQDAGYRAVGSSVPWRTQEFTNPHGESVAVPEQSGSCGDVRTSLSCLISTDYPTRYLVDGRDSTAQTCASLQTTDPLQQYFTGASMTAGTPQYAAALPVRQSLLQAFTGWLSQTGSVGIALSSINSRLPVPSPNANGNDIHYNDGLACSSGLDFATSNANQQLVIGECVMPIQRYARAYNLSTGLAHAYFNPAVLPNMGPRYTTEYASQAASQRSTGSNPQWRAAIKNEVLSRGGLVPGQPASATSPSSAPAMNRQAAATTAANDAYCFSSQGALINDSSQTAKAESATGVVIKVNAPDVFQVGGSSKPGTVTTDRAVLMCPATNGATRPCDHGANPLDPILYSLTYTLDLAGLSGFQPCSTQYGSSCQYYIKVPARANYDGQSVTGWFYSGTNPSQGVAVQLKNVSAAQLRYVQSTKTISLCLGTSGLSGSASNCKSVTVTQNIPDPAGPQPVTVRADTGSGPKAIAADGTVVTRTVLGAVGGTP